MAESVAERVRINAQETSSTEVPQESGPTRQPNSPCPGEGTELVAAAPKGTEKAGSALGSTNGLSSKAKASLTKRRPKLKPTLVSHSLRRSDASGAEGSGSREAQKVKEILQRMGRLRCKAEHTTVFLLGSFPIFKKLFHCKARREECKLEIKKFNYLDFIYISMYGTTEALHLDHSSFVLFPAMSSLRYCTKATASLELLCSRAVSGSPTSTRCLSVKVLQSICEQSLPKAREIIQEEESALSNII